MEEMISIMLCCVSGMSTSLLVEKMKEAASQGGIEVDIWVVGANEVKENADKADAILLGPQVRYAQKKIESEAPGVPVANIGMREYGMMGDAAALKQALDLIEKKQCISSSSYSVPFCIQFDRRESMQKICFKELVDLNHQLKGLVSISVDESINYKMEGQGMRAAGNIVMNGDYKDEKGKHSSHESIDLDTMALFEKITDKRDSHVKVEDFDYVVNEGNLSFVI